LRKKGIYLIGRHIAGALHVLI